MWHKRKNAKAEFATIQEPTLVGFRSAKRLPPFGVSFRSSFIYNQSPISEKRRFLHAQKPAAFVHHSSLVHVQVSVIASFAMTQELLYNSHRLDDDVLTVEENGITIYKFFGEIFTYAQNNFLCLYFDSAVHNAAFYANFFQ